MLAMLGALLDYPWRDEEALIQLHNARASTRLVLEQEDDEHLTIKIDGRVIYEVNHSEHGWAGMAAVQDVAELVHRAIAVRVIPDREHTIQISAAARRDFEDWARSGVGGSWSPAMRGGGRDGQRLTIEAVAGGGLLIRTQPYAYQRGVDRG